MSTDLRNTMTKLVTDVKKLFSCKLDKPGCDGILYGIRNNKFEHIYSINEIDKMFYLREGWYRPINIISTDNILPTNISTIGYGVAYKDINNVLHLAYYQGKDSSNKDIWFQITPIENGYFTINDEMYQIVNNNFEIVLNYHVTVEDLEKVKSEVTALWVKLNDAYTRIIALENK